MKYTGASILKISWGLLGVLAIFIAGCSWRGTAQKPPAPPSARIGAPVSQPQPPSPVHPELSPPVVEVPVEVIALPDAALTPPSPPQPLPEPPPVAVTPTPLPPPVVPVPAKSDALPPNTFRVTVALKDNSHPNYGVGNSSGFVVNGVQGKTLVVKRGEEYTFDVQTDVKHDFYLSTSPVGWGSGALGNGVRGNFTYRGEVTITPNEEMPETIYYQCRNHRSMGGKIVVVNAKSDVVEAQRQADREHAQMIMQGAANNASTASQHAEAKTSANSGGAAQQKMAFAAMLLKAKGNKLAPDAAKQFEKELADGNALAQGKDGARALAFAEDYIKRLNAATAGKSSDEAVAESRRAYQDLLEGVHSFEKSHAENIKRAQNSGGKRVDYDKKQVEGLVKEAAQLAEKQQYDTAKAKLQQAQRLITLAINEMLHQQTLVYDKKFATPKDEYDYELGRFDSYVELVPVAKEQKPPSAEMEKLIEPYSAKADNLRAMAVKSAGEGDHKNAILMLQAGTENVQRVLRLLGVSM